MRGGGTQIDDLLKSQLGHFEDLIGSRIFAEGPDFQLQAAAAQTLGMALHELATNAGKYGALSNDVGQVAIKWRVSPHEDGDDRFDITWTETRGPPVTVPDGKGFGSVVVGRMAEHGLKAKATTTFEQSGLKWHLTCKVKSAQEPRQ